MQQDKNQLNDWDNLKISLKLFEDSLDDFKNKCIKAGWSLNGHMLPKEAVIISKLKTNKEVDEYFLDYYMYCDKENYNKLNNHILQSSINKKYIKTYQQCIFAFNNEKYIVCICTLFSIIEGLIRKYVYDNQNITIESICGQILNKTPDNSYTIRRKIWEINKGIISKIFEYAKKNTVEPKFINRNWLLHGRSEFNVTQLDCLKLMSLIGTLSNENDKYIN